MQKKKTQQWGISDLPEDEGKQSFTTTYADCIEQAKANKCIDEETCIRDYEVLGDRGDYDSCQTSYGYAFSHKLRMPTFSWLNGCKIFIVQFPNKNSPVVKIIRVEDGYNEAMVDMGVKDIRFSGAYNAEALHAIKHLDIMSNLEDF